jgi:hypothetical protein
MNKAIETRFIIEVICEMLRRGGTVTKAVLQDIFRQIRYRYCRVDLNYGSWISHSDRRHIRNEWPHDPNNPDAPMTVTIVGENFVENEGVDTSSLLPETTAEREHRQLNEEFRYHSGGELGETYDEYISRKLNDPRE